LGLVAAVTVPRFSRAAVAPRAVNAVPLRDSLRTLRIAIERYYLDHRAYPAQYADAVAPAASAAAFEAQLTRYNRRVRPVANARDAVHRFGPYLRDGVPLCPLPGGSRAGVHVISGAQPPSPSPGCPPAGSTTARRGRSAPTALPAIRSV